MALGKKRKGRNLVIDGQHVKPLGLLENKYKCYEVSVHDLTYLPGTKTSSCAPSEVIFSLEHALICSSSKMQNFLH